MSPRRSVLRTWLAAKATLVTVALSVVPLTGATLAGTAPAQASYGDSIHRGWDACSASVSTAQAFWSNTPYWNMGLYLGGSSYGSGCKRWSTSEVNQLRSMGYQFLPLWVGPQAPCNGWSSSISYNTSTAYSQGRNEAIAVYNTISGLGWNTTNAPIIYDLEGFNTGNSSCLNAVKSFINGWVYQLHVAPAQMAGVYGSSCGSGLADYASLGNVPDFVTGADWNGNPSTSDLACIPSSYWTNRQRHKQYNGGHNETWNGVTMNIDSDCSNGPVYPGPNALTSPQGCE